MHRLFAAVVTLAGLQATAFAQAPALTLPGVSVARFEPGSVIRLPRTATATTVEVAFPGGGEGGRVDLHVDDRRLQTRALNQNGTMILVARTPEAAGFLLQDEQRLQMVRLAVTTETLAEWTILRWTNETGFIEAARSAPGGRAPDVRLDEPKGGAFVFRRRPATLTIKGAVLTPGPVVINVAGTAVEPVPSGRESTFQVDVPLPADLNEIEVAVRHATSGALRQIVLPVVTAR
jgi:hypothetical protein